MKQVKVGVVGAGRMGRNHCRVLSLLRHVDLVGISDLNAVAGATVATQYETQFFAQVDDLLARVDAVTIATPTPSHFALALRCLKQGLHLFIEKPVTETLEQAETLAETVALHDQVVQVGHIERFNPTFTELKHVLENLTLAAIEFRRLSPYVGSNTDVDVVLDLMIHDLDLVLDLVGEQPSTIAAYGLTAFSGAIDHAVVNLGFAHGPLFTVTASRLTEQKVRSIEVTALEGYIEGDLLNKQIAIHRSTIGEYLQQSSRSVKYRQESVVERIHVPTAEPLFLELQHFVACILENSLPLVPISHGLNVLELAMQVRKLIYGNLADIGSWRALNNIAHPHRQVALAPMEIN
ncbi:MAG: Gfo/Idh/MocA family oxidoreductase [Caldilineaceae bacterium]